LNNVLSAAAIHPSLMHERIVSMDQSDLNRRDFHRLTMAAFGGALAGSIAGCNSSAPPTGPAPPGKSGTAATATTGASSSAAGAATDTVATLENSIAAVGVEKHLCRGLNACKGQGAGSDNACAGQGSCTTLEHHACGGENKCKGQGGCGENALENECAQKGGCHVPLMDHVWKKDFLSSFDFRPLIFRPPCLPASVTPTSVWASGCAARTSRTFSRIGPR
jgi:hypothetical protein